MSVEATTWIWGLPADCISATERLVLLCLGNYADEDGSCWPGNEHIQQRTSLSERAIRNALRSVEAKGLMRMQQRRRMSPRYFLLIGSRPALGAPLNEPTGTNAENTPDNNGLECDKREDISCPAPGAGLVRPASGAVKTGTSCRLDRHLVPPIRQRYIKDTKGGERASARPTSHPLPEDWKPGEEELAFAANLGLNPETVALRFGLHFRAKGSRYADWSARWRLWCLEDAPPALAGEKGAAAGGEPAAAVAPVRDADGLSPRERAKAQEYLAMVQAKIPEDDQRRIHAASILQGIYPAAWEVVRAQIAA